jgi:hypothetical protein
MFLSAGNLQIMILFRNVSVCHADSVLLVDSCGLVLPRNVLSSYRVCVDVNDLIDAINSNSVLHITHVIIVD